ncbi:MAG: hypothetical protein ACRCTQ_01380 [Brevinemataceae bacterium]
MNTNISELIISYSSQTRVQADIYPKRVFSILRQLGFDPDSLSYIHTAGSKGKGSLSWTAFQILKNQGINTGIFTSPHIFDIRERITTTDGMISNQDMMSIIEEYHMIWQNHKLHFFEICLFSALIYFLKKKCRYVILEVGIGGRFDPTNFCSPILVLLGNISLEHTKFLGSTIQEIAYDKAGVIKSGALVLSLEQQETVRDIFLKEGNVSFFNDIITIQDQTLCPDHSTSFSLDVQLSKKFHINNIILNRIGEAHVKNFCLAAAGVLSVVPQISSNAVKKAALCPIPFRVQQVSHNILIDTAHNGDSFENLLVSVGQIFCRKKADLYLTILKGKELDDITEVLQKYKHLINHICVYDFRYNGTRESDGLELYSKLSTYFTVSYVSDVSNIDLAETSGDYKVFAGSFYSIPMILDLIQDQN